MSPINSALQYKIQKMERQLSSLMEENAVLRNIINEATMGSTPFAGPGGGGQFSGQQLGSYLAQGGNAYQGYLDQFGPPPTAMNQGAGTSTSLSRSRRSSGTGVAASMAAPGTNPGTQVPPFDGAMLGQLLAQAGEDGGQGAAQYLAQYGVPTVGGAQTATGQRRTNPLSRTRR